MSKDDSSTQEIILPYLKKTLLLQRKRNKQAKKGNKIARKQYQQSLLAYEQTERQYLLEKSKLQPSFRLSVTEFLLCEPDFMNDPEQAGEAQFLSELGVGVDERVLRFQIHVKGGADYLRPSLVVEQAVKGQSDDKAFAMSDLLYFVTANSLDPQNCLDSFDSYFIYRDKTTLPVLHKYRLRKLKDSTLLRWESDHIDTVYAMSQHRLSELKSAQNCGALFDGRGD